MRTEDDKKAHGWKSSIERLFNELIRLYSDRLIALQVWDVKKNNSRLESNELIDWMLRNHFHMTVIRIHRLLERNPKCCTLRNLAEDVIENFDFAHNKYPNIICESDGLKLFSVERNSLNCCRLKDMLNNATQKDNVPMLARHNYVAHLNAKQPDIEISPYELDQVVDAVGELFEVLSVILVPKRTHSLSHILSEVNETLPEWQWIFQEPWVKAENS